MINHYFRKKMMMKNLLLFGIVFSLFFGCSQTKKYLTFEEQAIQDVKADQQNMIMGSPLVGYSTMREVLVKARFQLRQPVLMVYKNEQGQTFQTEKITPEANRFNIVSFVANQLEPNQNYTYQIQDANTNQLLGKGRFQSQPLWQWRENPPAFQFAFGSCTYKNEAKYDRPGEPYGGDFGIFTQIYKEQPEFMLWGGDNIYLREADWNSMTGIVHRYQNFRETKELDSLFSNVHNYAIWDDHDFGPNDSDRSYPLRDSTLKAFQLFWANPSYGVNQEKGITSKFQWNDCEFFLLDNRYFRTPNKRKSGERHILGKHQIDWLMDNLSNSTASFKFVVVGGQVLNTASVYENHATYPQERQKLIDLIHQEEIKNVIFLSGDRHHSELSKLAEHGKPTIYDLTSSPLTSKTHSRRDEGNILQVKNSFLHQRNYALLKVDGEWGKRVLHIQMKDKKGEVLFQCKIEQEE